MSGFSIVNIERSARLHTFVKEVIEKTKSEDAIPRTGAILSNRIKEFKTKLARSRLYMRCGTSFQQAYSFINGISKGIGGDLFQTFLARCTEWSPLVHRLKTHASVPSSLSEFEEAFTEKFSIDFTGLLLPIHSPLDGYAILLFSWLEDDLAPTSGAPQIIFIACLVRIVKANEALAGIREVLTADDKAAQPALCELIPRHWLFGESPANSARLVDEVAIPHDRAAAFGKSALFHFVAHVFIDGSIFAQIDAEMDTIDREREALKKTKKTTKSKTT